MNAARLVAQVEFGIDAQQVQHRRGQIGGSHRAVGRVRAQAVRRAVDRSSTDAGSGQDQRGDLRSMVSAGVRIDLRRAAELAHRDEQRVVEHPALGEIIQ